MSLNNELKDPFVQHAQLFHSRSICFDEGSVDLTTKFHQTNSSDDMVGELLGAKMKRNEEMNTRSNSETLFQKKIKILTPLAGLEFTTSGSIPASRLKKSPNKD